MNLNQPPDWVPLLFVAIFFPAFWCLLLYLISVISGWRQLAKRYRCRTRIIGTTWRFQSAEIGRFLRSSYGSCLTVTANEEGIGLSVPYPFQVGHPPLFIPWTEILVSEAQRFFLFRLVLISFTEEPSVTIGVWPSLAKKIQSAIGHDWFPEANA